MRRRISFLLPLVAALALAPSANASSVRYAFAGGTPAEQAQIRGALAASTFPWGLIPGTVTVEIGPGLRSAAAPGVVWLDSNLLDAGRVSWGVVQHEFAHEVDFLLLDDAQRGRLLHVLGGAAWWAPAGDAHSASAAERFASSVAWAYWPSADNILRPSGPGDEGGELSPAAFRAALAAIVPGAEATRPLGAARTTYRLRPRPHLAFRP